MVCVVVTSEPPELKLPPSMVGEPASAQDNTPWPLVVKAWFALPVFTGSVKVYVAPAE